MDCTPVRNQGSSRQCSAESVVHLLLRNLQSRGRDRQGRGSENQGNKYSDGEKLPVPQEAQDRHQQGTRKGFPEESHLKYTFKDEQQVTRWSKGSGTFWAEGTAACAKILKYSHRGLVWGLVRVCVAGAPKGPSGRRGLVDEAKTQ